MKNTKYALTVALGLIALVMPRAIRADSTSAYVVTAAGGFGTVNLATGAYSQVATGNFDLATGLDETPGGTLYEYNIDNQLLSINPLTGATTLIGTGSIPGFSFGGPPGSGGTFFTSGGLTNGAYYAVNFNGDLYSINLANGATTLIGNMGVNVQQGMFGFVCEFTGLSGSATTLYYTVAVQPGCNATNQQLYSIDPTTAAATLIGQNFGANNPVIGSVYDNGTLYGFTVGPSEILQIDTSAGNATFQANTSQLITGGVPVPTPEPATWLLLIGTGLVGLLGTTRGKWLT